MRSLMSALSVAVAFAAFADAAEAADLVTWSTPAAACAVVEGRTLLETAGATVRFAPGANGAIRLVCPVTDLRFGIAGADAGTLGGLILRYQDSSGADGSAILVVELVRTPLDTGVPERLGGIDSDTLGFAQAATVQRNITPSAVQFDFATALYHLEVTLKRTTGDRSVSVTGLALTSPALRFQRQF